MSHTQGLRRTLWATQDVSWLAGRAKWKGLRSLIRVRCQRTVKGETSSECRYYISSLAADDPEKWLGYVRGPWSLENRLHSCLDIGFAEDGRRMRTGHGAENFARRSRIALNLLRAEKTLRVGLKSTRPKCGWDHNYLLRALTGPPREVLDA